jgi:hypothetical protein
MRVGGMRVLHADAPSLHACGTVSNVRDGSILGGQFRHRLAEILSGRRQAKEVVTVEFNDPRPSFHSKNYTSRIWLMVDAII